MKVITTNFGFDIDAVNKKAYQFVASSSLKRVSVMLSDVDHMT